VKRVVFTHCEAGHERCLAGKGLPIVPLLVALSGIFQCASAQDSIETAGLHFGGVITALAPHLELGGTTTARFRPLTQAERTRRYVKGTFGPFGVLYGAGRAGLHQRGTVPRSGARARTAT